MHQIRPQKARNSTFSGGACPQTPLEGWTAPPPLSEILDPPLIYIFIHVYFTLYNAQFHCIYMFLLVVIVSTMWSSVVLLTVETQRNTTKRNIQWPS